MLLPRFKHVCWLVSSALVLSSCSLFDSSTDKDADKPQDASGGYEDYLKHNLQNTDATNLNVASSEELERIDNGVEGEVYFTNPDDPDEEIAGITAAFESKRTGQRWLPNYVQGLRFSRLKGLPVILWFHDSAISPKSKLVARELLKTDAFMDWCKDRAICICLDSGQGMDDEMGSSQANENFRNIAHVQRRYSLTKKPSFVVISANGKVVKSIDGFDDYLNGLELDLKAAVAQADKLYQDYVAGLKKKGFREWRSRDGSKTIIAKITRFDQENDMIYLKEHTGRLTKIHESQFHNDDVDYIENNLRKGGPKY